MEPASPLLELGTVIIGLAILSRIAHRLAIPTIPLYLLVGLAFGEGGLLPLVTSEGFISVGAEIGLILLLFMLGLEYSASELFSTMKNQAAVSFADFALNFAPGLIAGLLLDMSVVSSILLGGVTYVTSSGIAAKLVGDLGRLGNHETPVILSIIVTEDLVMAFFLPLVAALLGGAGGYGTLLPVAVAVIAVAVILAAATRVEVGLSRFIFSKSDEALLLTILGLTFFIAGTAARLQVSAAVAALLVGIMLSGPAAEAAQFLLSPLRDLFAAIFFAFVGLSIDPSTIPPVLLVAGLLAVIGAATKFATGWIGAKRAGIGVPGRLRAGSTLVARGEFSIVIAGLATATGIDSRLEALAVTYVFVLAVLGPVLTRITDFVPRRMARTAR